MRPRCRARTRRLGTRRPVPLRSADRVLTPRRRMHVDSANAHDSVPNLAEVRRVAPRTTCVVFTMRGDALVHLRMHAAGRAVGLCECLWGWGAG